LFSKVYVFGLQTLQMSIFLFFFFSLKLKAEEKGLLSWQNVRAT